MRFRKEPRYRSQFGLSLRAINELEGMHKSGKFKMDKGELLDHLIHSGYFEFQAELQKAMDSKKLYDVSPQVRRQFEEAEPKNSEGRKADRDSTIPKT
jgi:hypothetical protein